MKYYLLPKLLSRNIIDQIVTRHLPTKATSVFLCRMKDTVCYSTWDFHHDLEILGTVITDFMVGIKFKHGSPSFVWV